MAGIVDSDLVKGMIHREVTKQCGEIQAEIDRIRGQVDELERWERFKAEHPELSGVSDDAVLRKAGWTW